MVSIWTPGKNNALICSVCDADDIDFFGPRADFWTKEDDGSAPEMVEVVFGTAASCKICNGGWWNCVTGRSSYAARSKVYVPAKLCKVLRGCFARGALQEGKSNTLHQAISQYLDVTKLHWSKRSGIDEAVPRIFGDIGAQAFSQVAAKSQFKMSPWDQIVKCAICARTSAFKATINGMENRTFIASNAGKGRDYTPAVMNVLTNAYMKAAVKNTASVFNKPVTVQELAFKPVPTTHGYVSSVIERASEKLAEANATAASRNGGVSEVADKENPTANELGWSAKDKDNKPEQYWIGDGDPPEGLCVVKLLDVDDPANTMMAGCEAAMEMIGAPNATSRVAIGSGLLKTYDVIPECTALLRARHPGAYDTLHTAAGPVLAVNLAKRQLQAARVGLDLSRVVTHIPSFANVVYAAKERIIKKQRDMCLPRAEKRALNNFVTQLADVVFSEARLEEWMMANPLVQALRSKTCTLERIEHEIEAMFGDMYPNLAMKLKVQCKREPVKSKKQPRTQPPVDGQSAGDGDDEEKPPRMIMNVGLRNQIVSLLTVKCFEDLWFGSDSEHEMLGKETDPEPNRKVPEPKVQAAPGPLGHIKGQDRGLCFKELIMKTREMSQNSIVFFIEGDGSAWDTCIQHALRELLENVFLQKICDQVCCFTRVDVPTEHVKAGMQRRRQTKESYKGETKVDTTADGTGAMLFKFSLKVTLKSIRESGDRGTSSLNQAVNKILWHFVLFRKPLDAILSRRVTDRHSLHLRCSHTEIDHHYAARHVDYEEGDDSGIAIQIDGVTDLDQVKLLLQPAELMWGELGFNMRIFVYGPGQVATFCGVNFLVGKHGLEKAYVPEILRSISTSSWSCNPIILRDGPDSKEGSLICYASFMSRAAAFPPTGQASYMRILHERQARAYLNDNVDVNTTVKVTHEMARKTGAEVGTDINLQQMLDDSIETFAWMDEEALDRITELTAGKVTPEDILAVASYDKLHRDTARAPELLPATWRANPQLPVQRVDAAPLLA